MKKVLFICTANICRSPMAVAVFDAIAEERGLDIRAESAGVAALVGEAMTPNAGRVIEELGVVTREHRARQASKEMLENADIVLTMTPRHRDLLLREFESLSANIHTLPEFAIGDADGGIADPYGHSIGTYRATLREILRYVGFALERLQREEVRDGPESQDAKSGGGGKL